MIPVGQILPGESFLENPLDREAWRATAHGVARAGHDIATTPPQQVKGLYSTGMTI